LAQEIHLHLQGIDKFVKAMDIVDYLETLEMKAALKTPKEHLAHDGGNGGCI